MFDKYLTGFAVSALAFAAVALAPAAASATTIDFETGAPPVFNETSPLTDYYSALGVNFSGIGGLPGSILNQAGNFGINAHSGVDFLAFNTFVGTGTGDAISFSPTVSSVSIYVGDGGSLTYTADAYDANGALLGSESVTPADGVWGFLSVSGQGIATVDLTSNGGAWVADDLSFNSTAVPEAPTWALLLAGFAGLAALGRRRLAAAIG